MFSSNKGKVIDLSSSHVQKVLEVKQLLELNANKINALLIQAQGQEKEALQQAYIDIKYANPVVDEKIAQIDGEISKMLDDLKLLYTRRIRSELTIGNKINNLLELIHERKAFE